MADLISREAAIAILYECGGDEITPPNMVEMRGRMYKILAVDAVEVSADELKHLINDTIAYIWRMEDSGRNKPEFGYDSRKALLKKLKQFEIEHFPEMACSYGKRREENAAD